MSWIPPNLVTLCSPHSTVSTCQPPTFMFLTLVAHLFGRSKDDCLYYHPSRGSPCQLNHVVEESTRWTPEFSHSSDNFQNSPKGWTYSYQFPTWDNVEIGVSTKFFGEIQDSVSRYNVGISRRDEMDDEERNSRGEFEGFYDDPRSISALATIYDGFEEGKKLIDIIICRVRFS